MMLTIRVMQGEVFSHHILNTFNHLLLTNEPSTQIHTCVCMYTCSWQHYENRWGNIWVLKHWIFNESNFNELIQYSMRVWCILNSQQHQIVFVEYLLTDFSCFLFNVESLNILCLLKVVTCHSWCSDITMMLKWCVMLHHHWSTGLQKRTCVSHNADAVLYVLIYVARNCFVYRLARCLWPVKDEPTLCFRKSSNFALWLPPLLTVMTMNCLFLLCQHSQTVQERPSLAEGEEGGGVGGVGWKLFILETNNLKEALLLPSETVT